MALLYIYEFIKKFAAFSSSDKIPIGEVEELRKFLFRILSVIEMHLDGSGIQPEFATTIV